jgi:uncharacterized protein YbcI
VVMQIDRPNDKAPNIGEVHARLCNEIIRFEKDIMGRGPEEVKAYIIDDMIILRLKGVLTRAEMNLLEHGEGEKEMALIKEFRQKLIEKNRHHLDEIIMEVTGCNIRSIHTDLSTRTGERVIIFVVY